MKPLKKPIKPLNYEANDKVYLYESSCFLSCFNTAGAPGGYWSAVPDATKTNLCGSNSTTAINGGCNDGVTVVPDCGPYYSCSRSEGVITRWCSGTVGVEGGCNSVMCADGAMVMPEGYQCTELQSWT
ncbi:hypothetical protein ABRY23_04670 [Melioribacteraceae bacterium 4301-Me]|uniref:hypothetical protein n=1 Tax=Pyranulibacter aquaticus TaxID=3163344 RepID=UPI0035975265